VKRARCSAEAENHLEKLGAAITEKAFKLSLQGDFSLDIFVFYIFKLRAIE
jgi:hypothetical protein